jgi:1,4-dihydroxy-2-naphthoate octaprenyltransferase
LFSTGLLNLNNLRDNENDRNSGKRTLVVLMGMKKSKLYHAMLISCGLLTALVFTILNYRNPAQFIYLVTFPLFIRNIVVVYKNKNAEALDPELKKLALTTLFFALTFGYGLTFH